MTEYERALREIGRRMAQEEKPSPSRETVFRAGTILSCPVCEEGLYKVTTPATTADLVLDDGTLLKPLNRTIPTRDVWRPLSCVYCGGSVYKAGRMHTVQAGWQ